MSRIPACILAFLLFSTTAALAGDTMPLSQVHKGMKGYGLTVFEGDKVERFDVEIIGVLNNIGPGQDLILAKVDHPIVNHAGIIAGMSGSPVLLDGKVIGALAFAWQFSKDPIAGITPIDEMLKIPQAAGSGAALAPNGVPVASGLSGGSNSAPVTPRLNAVQFLDTLANGKEVEAFEKMSAGALGAHPAMTGARPIAIPLSLSSFSADTVERFGKYLDLMGFMAVPSGSSASGTSTSKLVKSSGNKRPFEPGDAVGALLVDGDFNVAATGTVTHVDGDRIYAFGHPFLDMGEVSFPMAKSQIVTVLPNLASSFKFANTGDVVGALRQDRSVGIMGVVGDNADMIPVELTLDANGAPQVYHVNIVRHTELAPLMLAMAVDSVVANVQKAAGERTVLMDCDIQLKGFDTIHLREGWAGAQARAAIPAYLGLVSGYLMSNEFRDAKLESVKIHLRHDDQLRTAKLQEASLIAPENGRITPGDTVKVRAVLKPFRGEPFVETFDVKVPDNQAPGSAYILVGSGSVANQIDFSLVPPDPRTLEQVVSTLERLRPSSDLTVGLYSSAEGAVTAGVYLPNLPPSMRAVVNGDSSNGSQAPVKYHGSVHEARSLGYIVDGAVKIDLDVKPQI